MDPDDPDDFGRPSSPGVLVSRGEGDPAPVALWYGTFDELLRVLHDLWWRDRRIGRLRLLADWVADRGLFDPEVGRSILDDAEATRSALLLARDRLARRADPPPGIDEALVSLIRLLDEAIAAELPVRIDRR